jgi:hypothetical protein
MRFVHPLGPGQIGLNYAWLPTWLGMNVDALRALEVALKDKAVGRPVTEEVLDELHDQLMEVIETKYATIEGLRDYLDGIKFVRA